MFDAGKVIRFTFDRPVVTDSLRIWLDGNRLSNRVRQNGPASYATDINITLPRGPHRVRVTGMAGNGVSFDLSWGFLTGVRS